MSSPDSSRSRTTNSSRPWQQIGYAVGTILMVAAIVAIVFALFTLRDRSHRLVLYAGQEGGVYLELAEAIADEVDQSDSGIEIEVRETAGSLENLDHILADDTGEALALVQNDTFLPESSHGGARTLLPFHTGALHFLVPADSPIDSVPDLAGRTVAGGLPGSGTPPILEALLRYYEILDQVTVEPLGLEEACEALKADEVDAILLVMGLKADGFEELVEQRDIRFVGVGEHVDAGSEIEGFLLTYPFAHAEMIPKYTYAPPHREHPGIPEVPTPAVAVRTLLVANTSLSSHDAYHITRILVENRSSLARLHHSAAQIGTKIDRWTSPFATHRGADRYLHRDRPGFLHENAELFGFLLSLMLAGFGLLLSVKKWIAQRQKDRIDEYYLRLDDFLAELRDPFLPPHRLRRLDEEVWRMNRHAVHLLADEKLVADESFRIFQSFLSEVRSEIKHRLSAPGREEGELESRED